MQNAFPAQQPLPMRRAAAQASTSISRQLDSEDSDSDAPPSDRMQQLEDSPKHSVTVKYGRKAKAARERAVSGSGAMKRARSSLTLGQSIAAVGPGLTIGSNPSSGSHPRRSRPRAQTGLPRKRHLQSHSESRAASDAEQPGAKSDRYSSSLSPPPPSPRPSSLALRPFPLAPKGSSTLAPKYHCEKVVQIKKWTRKELGQYVWVLIDHHTRVFDQHDKDALEREHVWWPGKISTSYGRKGVQIPVYLYGHTTFKIKDVEVKYPTNENILPYLTVTNEPQFQLPMYVVPSRLTPPDNVPSPRKKSKRDHTGLEGRWHAALNEMSAEYEKGKPETDVSPAERQIAARSLASPIRDTDDESLPEVGGIDWKSSIASLALETQDTQQSFSKKKGKQKENGNAARGQMKRKRKSNSLSDNGSDYGILRMEEHSWGAVREKDEDGWAPVPADEALQLPGEIILSRGSDWDKSYWPARILAYLPPKSKREKEGKYQIEYLDRTTGLVKRSAFFSSDEDGFATCKLGQFESSYDEVGNDSDSEDLLGSLGSTRSPSPALMDSPPTQEEFCALSIRAQFVYTKPVLIAILNDRYPPAKGRHDNFIKGGAARKAVVDNAALRGDMTPRSVGELQRWICEWCLRDERFAQRQFDQGAASNHVTGAGSDTTKGSESSNAADVSGLVIIEHDAVLPHATTTKAESLSAQMKPDVVMTDVSTSNHKEADKESSLSSPLSDLTRETTPMSIDSETKVPEAEVKPVSGGHDIEDVLSDLTEIEDTKSLDAEHSLITKMPRQQGCEAYETLSSVEKIDYCLNVLLPEAILQILLWRNGLRRAVELLPLDEEERLHDQGIQLLQVTDWVFDVMRLRNSRLRLLAKTESNESINNNQKICEKRGGGRLRSAIPKVNYQE